MQNKPETSPLTAILLQAGIIEPAQQQQLLQKTDTPWWLSVLMAPVAWIASLLIISAFIGPLLAINNNNLIPVIAGGLLLVGSIALSKKNHEFIRHLTVPLALAGHGLLVYASYLISASNDETARYAAILLSIVLFFTPLNALYQRISLAIACACIISLLPDAQLTVLFGAALAAAAVLCWCCRQHWASTAVATKLTTLRETLTLLSLVITLWLQHWLHSTESWWWHTGNTLQAGRYLSSLAILLLVATVFWLSLHAELKLRFGLLTISMLVAALLFSAPALLFSSTLMLACFYGCSQRWYWLSLFFMLLSLSEFYYSLQLNLLYKSGLLAATAVLLLLCYGALCYYQRRKAL